MPFSSDYQYAIVRANSFTPSATGVFELVTNGCYSYSSAPNLGAYSGGWAGVTGTGMVITTEVDINFWAIDSFVNGVPDAGGAQVSVNGGTPTDTPPTGVYTVGTTIDLYGGWPTTASLEPLMQVGIDLTYEPSGGGGGGGIADSGIYVGSIVLGEPVAGIYRYNGEDGSTFTGAPGVYRAAYENAPWRGSLDGLSYTTGGFFMTRVQAETAGIYDWTVTPLFLVDNSTSFVAVALYDGVGDFQGIDSEAYVASGDTLTGNVYIPEGWYAAFLVGDDDTGVTQQILTGSFWNFIP